MEVVVMASSGIVTSIRSPPHRPLPFIGVLGRGR